MGKSSPILAEGAFIVFVDMLGIWLILPVMPRLIGEIAQTSLDRSAEIGGLRTFAYPGMQFLCAPFIAGLSDRFVRRPVLLTCSSWRSTMRSRPGHRRWHGLLRGG